MKEVTEESGLSTNYYEMVSGTPGMYLLSDVKHLDDSCLPPGDIIVATIRIKTREVRPHANALRIVRSTYKPLRKSRRMFLLTDSLRQERVRRGSLSEEDYEWLRIAHLVLRKNVFEAISLYFQLDQQSKKDSCLSKQVQQNFSEKILTDDNIYTHTSGARLHSYVQNGTRKIQVLHVPREYKELAGMQHAKCLAFAVKEPDAKKEKLVLWLRTMLNCSV
jgi:hypothetical protein